MLKGGSGSPGGGAGGGSGQKLLLQPSSSHVCVHPFAGTPSCLTWQREVACGRGGWGTESLGGDQQTQHLPHRPPTLSPGRPDPAPTPLGGGAGRATRALERGGGQLPLVGAASSPNSPFCREGNSGSERGRLSARPPTMGRPGLGWSPGLWAKGMSRDFKRRGPRPLRGDVPAKMGSRAPGLRPLRVAAPRPICTSPGCIPVTRLPPIASSWQDLASQAASLQAQT